jgi:hypothetical protein
VYTAVRTALDLRMCALGRIAPLILILALALASRAHGMPMRLSHTPPRLTRVFPALPCSLRSAPPLCPHPNVTSPPLALPTPSTSPPLALPAPRAQDVMKAHLAGLPREERMWETKLAEKDSGWIVRRRIAPACDLARSRRRAGRWSVARGSCSRVLSSYATRLCFPCPFPCPLPPLLLPPLPPYRPASRAGEERRLPRGVQGCARQGHRAPACARAGG